VALIAAEPPLVAAKVDRDALLTFYDFPAQHWKHHLRTTNPRPVAVYKRPSGVSGKSN
jgi:hypothetical protein